jgi:hypothetical protein
VVAAVAVVVAVVAVATALQSRCQRQAQTGEAAIEQQLITTISCNLAKRSQIRQCCQWAVFGSSLRICVNEGEFATSWRVWQNEPKQKQTTFSQGGRVGARMVMMNVTRHGSANSAPRPHRDGRTAYIQSRRLVI